MRTTKDEQEDDEEGDGEPSSWGYPGHNHQPMQQGDWMCPNCGDHVFGRNQRYRSCQALRPADNAPRQPLSKGGLRRKRQAFCIFYNEGRCEKRSCPFPHKCNYPGCGA